MVPSSTQTWIFNRLMPKVTMTSEVKGQGHFIILLFYGSGKFIDWFWKVTKSINGVFIWFTMFNLNFRHDLDLWPWRSFHQWSPWSHKWELGKLIFLLWCWEALKLGFLTDWCKGYNDLWGQRSRSFYNFIFYGPGKFIDWFWKVTKSINGVFMWFTMFNLNFEHDLDLWPSRSCHQWSPWPHK